MSKTLLLLILTISAVPVASQTLPEIEAKYGKPTLAYSVTDAIWMTPDFAADGQVCRMRFYPKSFYRNTVYLDHRLRFRELKWILNQIVPPSSRGKRKTSFGLSTLGGGLVSTAYEYEKVTFTFAYTLRFRIDPKALEQGEFVLLDDFPVTELPPPPPPSESDFDDTIEGEVVSLRWNDRTCAENAPPNFEKVAEIEQRFGPPKKIYPVSEHTSMSADFATDGQVCQLRLYSRRLSGARSHLGNKLQLDEVETFLNSFVPREHRGRPRPGFGNISGFNRSAWTWYTYENVEFTFVSRFLPAVIAPLPSNHGFRRTNDTHVVTVRWLRRTCAAQ